MSIEARMRDVGGNVPVNPPYSQKELERDKRWTKPGEQIQYMVWESPPGLDIYLVGANFNRKIGETSSGDTSHGTASLGKTPGEYRLIIGDTVADSITVHSWEEINSDTESDSDSGSSTQETSDGGDGESGSDSGADAESTDEDDSQSAPRRSGSGGGSAVSMGRSQPTQSQSASLDSPVVLAGGGVAALAVVWFLWSRYGGSIGGILQ